MFSWEDLMFWLIRLMCLEKFDYEEDNCLVFGMPCTQAKLLKALLVCKIKVIFPILQLTF